MRKIVRIGMILPLFAVIMNVAGCDGDADGLIIPENGIVEHGCAWSENLSESRPDDFAFLFHYGYGNGSILSTFEGTYTKDLGTTPSVTIDFSLTEEDLDRIYAKMLEIDFFCYPIEFVIPPPESGIVTMISDYQEYYFRVRCNNEVKVLRWKDMIQKEDENARNLRKVISLIKSIIQSKPEYRELPSYTGVRS